MASSIKNLVRGIEEAIMETEKQEEYEEMIEADENIKTAVTTRFDSMQIAYLDMLAKKCDLSRSAMVCELAGSALVDVMNEMGLTDEFFKKITDKLKKENENV